ncbi:CopD family protein [Ensifer sp. HO-A22]|uniref:Protoporphyrinogen IX oxidase n=1 Tax=Ensifer oleiphilus TaxID=2742698 RepID=A0A7Y6QCJ2_9HYPH|nr:CopD family protein [Ensifer oleiphilus]NVD43119.1 CopD family protein [Ensifer oleiphilus]
MLDLIVPYYLWVKAAHVVSVIVWLGGQCLLVVQLASHRQVLARGGDADVLSEVEQRCLRLAVNPAMLATLLLGATLFFLRGPELLGEGWFQAKLAFVVAMMALHGAIAATVASLRRETVSAIRIRVLQIAGLILTATLVSIAVIK